MSSIKLPKQPLWVWCLIAIFLLKGLFWAYLIPPWEAPDELGHYSYVESMYYEGKMPQLGVTTFSRRIELIGPKGNSEAEIKEKQFLNETVIEGALGGFEPIKYIEGKSLNWIAQHPPLYYLLQLPFYSILPHNNPLLTIFFLRLLSLVLGAITIFLSYKIIKKILPENIWLQKIVPISIAFLPTFTYLSASLNNDNLLITLTTFLLWVMVKNNERSWKRGLKIGLILGAMLLTKASAIAMVAAVIAFEIFEYIRKWWEQHQTHAPKNIQKNLMKSFIVYCLWLGIASFIIGGWWYLKNKIELQMFIPELAKVTKLHPEILQQYPQLPAIFPEVLQQSYPQTSWYDFFIRENFIAEYLKNFFGAFGQFFFRLFDWQYGVWVILLIGAVVGHAKSWWQHQRSREKLTEASKIMLAFSFFLIAALIIKLYDIFKDRGFLGALHGRYLFPILVPIMYAIWSGIDHLFPEHKKAIVFQTLILFVVFNEAITLLYRIIPEFF